MLCRYSPLRLAFIGASGSAGALVSFVAIARSWLSKTPGETVKGWNRCIREGGHGNHCSTPALAHMSALSAPAVADAERPTNPRTLLFRAPDRA